MRNHPGSVNPLIKSNNLLNNALAMQEAFRRGAFEGVMRNYRGELAECTTANLFIVKNGEALTPPLDAGLLAGITREFVFEVGEDVGIAVREQVLQDDDLFGADEAFLTSTTRELVPISQVDDSNDWRGRAGPGDEDAAAGLSAKGARGPGLARLRLRLQTWRPAKVRTQAALRVFLDRRARADQIAVAVRVVDASDAGQNLFARTNGSGNAACSREYGWVQSSAATAAAVCGAFFSTLSLRIGLAVDDRLDLLRGSRSSRRRSDRAPLSVRSRSARPSACRRPETTPSARESRSPSAASPRRSRRSRHRSPA